MNTPTPETDELVNRCGSFEINEQIWADELATLARKLERERDELKSWKESMLAVESAWNPHEIARLLDIKLGSDIRAQLKPAIVRLIGERDEAVEITKERFQQVKKSIESDSIVGSCECLTKTPDAKHHAKGCKYRLIIDRDQWRKMAEELAKCLSTVKSKTESDETALSRFDEMNKG